MRSIPWLSPMTSLAIGGLGFLVAFTVLLLPSEPLVHFAALFEDRHALVWAALYGGQGALLAVLAVPLWAHLVGKRSRFRGRRLELAAGLAVLLALLLLFLFAHEYVHTHRALPVDFLTEKIVGITAVGYGVLAPALLGMALIAVAARQMAPPPDEAPADVEAYFALKEDLRSLLGAAGMIIGAATLSIGALRPVLGDPTAAEAGVEGAILLIYGAFGSGIIALVYVPAFLAVRGAGVRLRDAMMGQGTVPDGDGWVSWFERRKKLDGLLGIDVDPVESLKAGLALLTPLAGSALSIVLGR